MELSLVVAGSLVAHILCLVGAVHAVGISITLPSAKDAATRLFAFELMLRTLMVAVFLIASISTIVPPVADCRDEGAIIVLALELTVPTLSLGA